MLLLLAIVTLFTKQIEEFWSKAILFCGLLGSLGLALVALIFKTACHDIWHKRVHEKKWQAEDFAFLVEVHNDRLIPNYNAIAHESAPAPFDQDRGVINSSVWHILWKTEAEQINQMTPPERSAIINLLKSDDVRIVKRVLELVEKTMLIEALPLVRRLVDGKLRTSGDIYNTPIAERVLGRLEAQIEKDNATRIEQQYLRHSSAPNSELLHPAMPKAQQEDNLLRPMNGSLGN